ncbi:MAG: hypothetical protein OQJ87_09495 [Rhodospirillales bacterium]|nr:hypothetical protein [Rhodospirillales bacterium]
MTGFCGGCAQWVFETNGALQTDDERDGFGLCERFGEMRANRARALVRATDEFAELQTRSDFGCVLFEAR